MKAVYIKDLEVYLVTFPYGGEYYLGDQLLTSKPREIELESLEGITKKKSANEFSHYQNRVTGAKITREKYRELLNVVQYDEDDEPATVEDHYVLKGLQDTWECIYKIVETFEPVEIELDKVVCNTSSKFIQNGFFVGGDPKIYTYNREACAWETIRETFKECGMVYEGKIKYEKTENTKIWGGDSLRFLVAFGGYMDFESYEGVRRGTLEQMEASLKKDVEGIREGIKLKYNLHFSNVSLKVGELYSGVMNILSKVATLDVKRKAEDNHRRVIRHIVGLKEKLELQIKEGTDADNA